MPNSDDFTIHPYRGYGKPAMEKISTTYIRECADHYVANQVTFDLIFVGYLGSEGMIEAVEYFFPAFPTQKLLLIRSWEITADIIRI